MYASKFKLISTIHLMTFLRINQNTLWIRKFQSLYFFPFFSDYNFSHKDKMGNVTTLCE